MFTDGQIENIIKEWGGDVYAAVSDKVNECADKWELSDVRFHDSYSMNAIFFCTSKKYGQCVLKISCGIQVEEFNWELNILHEYKGAGYVNLHECDETAMLIERVVPGTQLCAEPSLDRRLEIFTGLFKGNGGTMHIAPKNVKLYQSYSDGVRGNAKLLEGRDDRKDLHAHFKKAVDVLNAVASAYNREMLLHGDLQYHNILKSGGGAYKIIDPQGRTGDPIFDMSRYILVEYYNFSADEQFEKIKYIINHLSESLCYDSEIIKKCFYIEMVSFECWWASFGDYDINNTLFAERIMG